jgi:two-component sensor histidine kinase
MAMKRSFEVLLHIGFWLAHLIFVAMIMFAALRNVDIPPQDRAYYFWFITGIGIVPPVLSFYLNYYILFPRYLQKRKVFLSLSVGLLLAAGAASSGLLLVSLMNADAYNCLQEGWPYAIGFTWGISIVYGIIALVLKGFLTWYEELKLKEELMEKNFNMELALVKSQLDPHFLFNTINNIDILISKDPAEASNYLNKLSDIMRFMLYETKTEEIALAKELEYIEKYIQLQRIRTANKHFVDYEVKGHVNGQKVAPMVFIPFIENAFKHSANKKIDHAVQIDISVGEQAIIFKCRNKFEPKRIDTDGANGLGNELIRKRLQLLYPQKHTLLVDRRDDQYSVELSIPNGTV